MRITLGDHIVEINERTTTNNQHRVLTSSQKGIVSQDEYFNKQIASKENTGYKIVKRGQFTYRAMSDTGRFYINRLMEYDVGIVSPAYPVFEVIEDNIIYTPYIVLFFESDYFQSLIVNQSTGSTRVSLKLDKIKRISIDIPSYQEQKEIVEKIESVKRAIAARDEQLSCFNELVKSRFIELFGDTPDGEKVAMADICRIITDGTHQPPKFVSEGIPFLFVSNIVTNEIRYDAQKFISEETYAELIKRTPIAIGDILLSTVGSYGHPAVVKTEKPFCFQRHIAYLKPNADIVDSEYLRGAILSADVQRQIDEGVKGIAQKTLNLSEIRKIRLPLPPIELQEQFAAFVEQTDKSKLAVQKALEELEILKKSLMQQYFG